MHSDYRDYVGAVDWRMGVMLTLCLLFIWFPLHNFVEWQLNIKLGTLLYEIVLVGTVVIAISPVVLMDGKRLWVFVCISLLIYRLSWWSIQQLMHLWFRDVFTEWSLLRAFLNVAGMGIGIRLAITLIKKLSHNRTNLVG